MNKITKVTLVAGALAVFASGFAYTSQDSQAMEPGGYQTIVDDKGAIVMPEVDFRKDWTALGTWAIAADEGTQGSKGFHVVYTQPETVAAYRKTGKFPDGAVLVKELFSTTTHSRPTGIVSQADGLTGTFVMVKDTKNRFPGNKLWGDGWGWAFFNTKDSKMTPTKDYKEECLGCHVPAQDTDWIYVQGYPVLKK